MAYLSATELVTYMQESDVQQLSDDVNGQQQAEEIITPILDSASDMCDSYLSVRYTVPIPSPGFALKSACASVAIYMLHLRRSWTVTDTVEEAYKKAIAFLKDIAAQKANLQEGTASASATGSYFHSEDQVFTSDSMQGFG